MIFNKIILLFLYLFLLRCIFIYYKYGNIPFIYIVLIVFVMIKMLFNYRICSLAYAECKIRNIPRDKSYVNKFLDPIVDVRYTNHIYPLFIISFVIIYLFIIKYLKTFINKI